MSNDRPRSGRTGLLLGAVLAIAAAGTWFALRPDGRDVDVVRTAEEHAAEGRGPQEVEGGGDLPTAPGTGPARRPSPAPDTGGEPVEEGPQVLLTGTVLEDDTGRPVAGATVVVSAAQPDCPAPPEAVFHAAGDAPERSVLRLTMAAGADGEPRLAPVPEVRVRTGEDGRFAAPWTPGVEADVYARHPGFVVRAACRQPPTGPVTLRLRRGRTIQGVVVREDGAPVLGATVECEPDPAAQGLVGHRDVTTVGAKGEFVLGGLLGGLVRVTASHPKFVATVSDPVEAGARDLRLVLVPAFHVAIRISPDDAQEPETATTEWRTEGRPPRSGLVLLQRAEVPHVPDAPQTGPVFGGGFLYEPVAVPCDRATVTFVVKAVGYEPWTSEALEIPRDGGERTLEVPLRRDPNLGRLIVRVEGEDGRALSWVGEGCQAEVGRRDGQAVPAGIILQGSEVLELPALPSGPYTLRIVSPKHAPAVLEASVPAGGTEEARVTLRPPARVRVKFVAPDPLIVRFRLLKGREIAPTWTENSKDHPDPNAEPGEQIHVIGSEGLLLTGLGTGRYVVEVVSPDLSAPSTGVDLVEGETREVEIAVTTR